MTVHTLWIACFAMLVACGKETAPMEASQITKEAPPATSEEPTTEEPAATPEPAEDPEAVAGQCERILAAGWKAAKVALDRLGVSDVASLEAGYVREMEADELRSVCKNLDKKRRDCLEQADNAIAALIPCGVNPTPEGSDLMRFPKLPTKGALVAPQPLPAEQAAAILKRLPGVWVNEDMGREVLTIDAEGNVSTERFRGEEKQEPRSTDNYTITFSSRGMADLKYSSNSQSVAFAMPSDSDDVFYLQGNLMWRPWPLDDEERFVVIADFDVVLVERGACTVVTHYGLVLPGDCSFSERDGARWFDVRYQIPGKKGWRSEELEPEAATFLLRDGMLLPADLLKRSRYERLK